MHFEKLFQNRVGKILVSIILGLGLATLFRASCQGDKCYNFIGPEFHEIKDKKYKFDNKCYAYRENAVSCNKNKTQLYFS